MKPIVNYAIGGTVLAAAISSFSPQTYQPSLLERATASPKLELLYNILSQSCEKVGLYYAIGTQKAESIGLNKQGHLNIAFEPSAPAEGIECVAQTISLALKDTHYAYASNKPVPNTVTIIRHNPRKDNNKQ